MLDNHDKRKQLSAAKQEFLAPQLLGSSASQTNAETSSISRPLDTFAVQSFAQYRFWMVEQLHPGTAAYNISMATRLIGPLNIAALEKSLSELVQRHESLRTTLSMVDDQPVQRIAPIATPFSLSTVDLRSLGVTECEQEMQRLTRCEARTPFDLTAGPLFRVQLLQLDNEHHVLLVTLHHSIADGWSISIFNQELNELYTAFCYNKPSPLSELPIQYADYASWQRDQFQGSVLQDQLIYWKQQLTDPPTVLELPADHLRPANQTFRGATWSFTIPSTVVEPVRALGRREDATLFMTLLAAFQVLLARYTEQDDFLVGSPVAGRTRTELEGLIGSFVNTLVLRADLSGEPSFRTALSRVRETCLNAYAHQDLPFERLVEELHPERDLSRNPLVQIFFAFHNVPMKPMEMQGLQVSQLLIEGTTARSDLTMDLTEVPDGLQATIEYSTDLFEKERIERLAQHYQQLLEGIAADPKQCIWHLPLLTQPEQWQLLEKWNATQAPYSRNRCIHQLFEVQAEQTPDAVAVVYEDQHLSYSELDRRANQLAHYLRKLNVGPEVLVGLCVERSLEIMVALLGILKAGGSYVPLDPGYPQERLTSMLTDSRAQVILTQQHLQQHLPVGQMHIVCLDKDWVQIAKEPDKKPSSLTSADNCAYVIFTSGSTGRPKGVQIQHQNVVNFLEYMRQKVDMSDQDRHVAVTTLSFDIAGLELYLPLTVGACVVIAPRLALADGTTLRRLLATSGATSLQATPVTWKLLLDAGWTPNTDIQMLCGGEALARELANHLLDHQERLWNLYGPTETTIWSTIYRVMTTDRATIPIGKPIANTQIYVLDRHLQPVPIGIPGELYIGGDGLARGYLHRPNLTAERFLPHPFSTQPGARLYKTGDLVRYLSDGNLEFLKRTDQQVKIRGFRVELGEIEAVLLQHPRVQDCTVVVHENQRGDRYLVAYIVARQGQTVNVISDTLRQYMRERLPEYMIPAEIAELEALPRTLNGKVDRQILSRTEYTSHSISHQGTYVTPRDETEVKLQFLWKEILDVYPIGVTENFFDLGGHSLSIVQLLTRIKRVFGRELSLTTLFQYPTVEGIARMLREPSESKDDQISSPLIELRRADNGWPFFCAHPADENLVCYFALARYLGERQSFYGLQSPIFYGDGKTSYRVETVASSYVNAVRSIQPHGPYLLGGWSTGGVFAFEMAQQLYRQEERVALLVLIDTPAPPYSNTDVYDVTSAVVDFASFLGRHNVHNLSVTHKEIEYLTLDEQLQYVLHAAKKINPLVPDNLIIQEGKRLVKTILMSSQAMKVYQPQVYPGQITLLRARDTKHRTNDDLSLGWNTWALQPTEVYMLPGTHSSIMIEDKALPVLAAYLRKCIEKTRKM